MHVCHVTINIMCESVPVLIFARFNLLLLEPGEIYFEDYSVTYFPKGTVKADKEKRYM